MFLYFQSDLTQLSESDSKTNLKIAFKASDSESIVRVVDIGDVYNKKSPDQLSIMTYLFNICDHFEPKSSRKISKKNVKSKSKTLINMLPNKLNKEVKKKSPAPVLNEKLLTNDAINQNKNTSKYFNPFDEDENEDENHTIKNSTMVSSSGLIQIKPSGEIVDASESESRNKTLNSQNEPNKIKDPRKNSQNNSSPSSFPNSSIPVIKVSSCLS